MPERPRFHLDEAVDPAVARALRRQGLLVHQLLSSEEMRDHVEFL